ncbi:MAG: hypothetical protein P1U68_10560 [Verrucomicrobiales bacterium]|nr:hypothetical protein [Verrucomicrobiales bacterium]
MRNQSHSTEGSANPFVDDIYLDHPDLLPGVTRIHHRAFDHIVESVESLVSKPDRFTPFEAIGRTILVTAPRAGYGKSHLAARLRHHLSPSATTLTLPLDPSRPISWPVALSSILRQYLNEPGHQSSERSLVAESGHFLLSQLILSHRHNGSLKSGQCPVDDETLRSNFHQLFEQGSELLNWTDAQSRDLTRRADSSFLHALSLGANELGFWVRLIIDFTLRGDTALESLRGLSNGEARERLLQWLRIATFYRPSLIVADGLDGFFRSESAGMEIAGLITGIRESVPRSITLVCLNEDIWKSVFEEKLPSAWLDRLTGETEKLRAISPETAAELITERLKETSLSPSRTGQFVDRLRTDHLWVDSEARLFPRAVIRQARELWDKESSKFLAPAEGEPEATEQEPPLSSITDKVAFFEALSEDRPLPLSAPSKEETTEATQEFSFPPPSKEEPIENPFFAPPEPARDSKLVGIDSIIDDIRGSGKTVVSESAQSISGFTAPSQEKPETGSLWEAGELRLRSADDQSEARVSPPPPQLLPKPMTPSPERKPDWVKILKTRETALMANEGLTLNLEKVEEFIRLIGREHPGLSQSEERFPSSRTVCVRWNVRGESVLLGFESPQNVYFWNNLLQQSLASNRREKLAAFSHRTEPFNPNLFSSFGFSPTVIKDRIDIIEMNDRELAMIFAADSIISESQGTDEAPAAIQIAIRYLDPLWRRISRPV